MRPRSRRLLPASPPSAPCSRSALLVAGCGGGGSTNAAVTLPQVAGADAVPAKTAPPIELTDQYGKKVDLAKLKGHSVLVAFLYTHCTDLCPIVAGKLHTAYAHPKRPNGRSSSPSPSTPPTTPRRAPPPSTSATARSARSTGCSAPRPNWKRSGRPGA